MQLAKGTERGVNLTARCVIFVCNSLSENLSYKVRESVRRTCDSLCPSTTPPCPSLYVVRSNRRFSDRIFRRSTNSQSAQRVQLFERTAVVAVFVNEARSSGSSREIK